MQRVAATAEEARGLADHDGPYHGVGMRRVLCAVILQAVEDAQRGDGQAAAWLTTTGASWAARLGLNPAVLGQWRLAAGRIRAERRRLAKEASGGAGFWG